MVDHTPLLYFAFLRLVVKRGGQLWELQGLSELFAPASGRKNVPTTLALMC